MASTVSRNVAESHRTDSREGLSSWWARFKSKPAKKEPEVERSIFSVPLQESITYANVAISLYNDDGQTFIYGYIPIIVAKCGLFLKDNATETEGIFRLSGSSKRIKDLQAIFDHPPKYGKNLDWAGFTVHDAANILRRYLNHLPDPIIPYDWYDAFREPLKDGWASSRTIPRMQELVSSLPPLNRQLLLYILDLLAVFASKSEINRMTSENLSAIFQPGLITHPRDDMAPQEYKLSQEVLVFLIDNQSHFLLDSLCTPTKDQNVSSPGQKKTSIIRRRTLQAPKRTPTKSLHVPHTEGSRSPSPRSSLQTRSSATVSRSNTVPTKRNLPTRLGSATEIPARHVSTPILTKKDMMNCPPEIEVGSVPRPPEVKEFLEKGNHKIAVEASDAPRPEVVTSHHHSAGSPQQKVQRKSHRTGSPQSSNLDSVTNSEGMSIPPTSQSTSSPAAGFLKSETDGSRRTSPASSLVNEADFKIMEGRALSSEQQAATSPPSSVQRPLSTMLGSGGLTTPEKSSRGKETRAGTQPSKFSNLFKKKPRNRSISSTSEAGGRRDLDK